MFHSTYISHTHTHIKDINLNSFIRNVQMSVQGGERRKEQYTRKAAKIICTEMKRINSPHQNNKVSSMLTNNLVCSQMPLTLSKQVHMVRKKRE